MTSLTVSGADDVHKGAELALDYHLRGCLVLAFVVKR